MVGLRAGESEESMKISKSMVALLLVLMFGFSSSASALQLNAASVTQLLKIYAQLCKISGLINGIKVPYCDTVAEATPAIEAMAKGSEGIARGDDALSVISGMTTLSVGALDFKSLFNKDSTTSDINDSKNKVDQSISDWYTKNVTPLINSANTSGTNPGSIIGGSLGYMQTATSAQGIASASANANGANSLALTNGTNATNTSVERAKDANTDGQKLLEQSNLAVSTRATIGITNEILVKMLDHSMSNNVNMTTLIATNVQVQAMTNQQINNMVNIEYVKRQEEGAYAATEAEGMNNTAISTGKTASSMLTDTSNAISIASNPSFSFNP